ncbi:MAG: selenide, water dikinase SelD, partial [Pseudomonadales bacterium]|nr:selenide, water dikinase SelD [Pseudomonadales bacterium]
ANGFVSSDDVWSKAGAQAGDVLLLTKALGTGTLLAANKQYRARGDWVKGAVDSMLLSNRAAVSILRDYDIKACTDITGFGLAGHLEEMLGKQWGATLEASNIPVLPGALSCLQEGISSSLHSANRRSVKSQKLPSLFYDPQTSGGLLIALPGSEAEACMNGLRQAGYNEATVIGEVTAGTEVTLR